MTSGLGHLHPQVVALAGPLADAGEHRGATEVAGDAGDHLLDEHRLADARAAEQADLAALDVRGEQVDDLQARPSTSVLPSSWSNGGGLRWIAPVLGVVAGPGSSMHSPRALNRCPLTTSPTGTEMARPVSWTSVPADGALGGLHRDGAHLVVTEVLGDLEGQLRGLRR